MAHFAKIGLNGKVLQVLTLNNTDMLNADGVEDETVGQQYLERHNNWTAQMWIQTSYNTSGGTHNNGGTAFRKNYAGIGYTYDEDRDAFIPKKPYNSWILNEETCLWEAPIGYAPELTDAQIAENTAATHSWSYVWNEDNQSWDLTNI